MSIYQEYAPFYDGSGQIRFSILMSHYLDELLERHPVTGSRVLDLACGTGTLALMLADAGWDVVGLDRAAAMLQQAQAKAANMDLLGTACFIQGDMRNLPPIDPTALTDQSAAFTAGFDLITCVYDSLNYLLEERELAACFASTANTLVPDGVLICDMNTRHFLEYDWGTCEVLEQSGFIQVAQSYFDPTNACSTMVLTGFAGDDEHGYRRFDETHIERAYTPQTIADLLTAAGLQIEAIYDCFTFQPITEYTQRIAWVARKPNHNHHV